MKAPYLPEVVSIAELAGLFGVTPRQARNLLEGAKVKSTARGAFPLALSIRAVLTHARENRETDELAKARARTLNAKAKAQELALARQERELIPMDDAIAEYDALVAAVRDEMFGLPVRIARDNLNLRRKIEGEVHGAQKRIAKVLTETEERVREGVYPDDAE